jgi:hypothetical protein
MSCVPLYIFDLDGTLADISHRMHFIKSDPTLPDGADFKPRWDIFFAACKDDKPITPMISLLDDLGHQALASVYIWTGRDENVRDETINWLRRHVNRIIIDELRMRTHGDHRPDHVIKEEWLKALDPDDRARLICVFEDRDQVVKMWRDNGVACCQVAPGGF